MSGDVIIEKDETDAGTPHDGRQVDNRVDAAIVDMGDTTIATNAEHRTSHILTRPKRG